MKKKQEGRRLFIDQSVCDLLAEKVTHIKSGQEFAKINEGRLASEILSLFFKKYYEKESSKLAERFFDKKLFLKNFLSKSHSEEELEEAVSQIIGKPKGRRGRPKKLEESSN